MGRPRDKDEYRKELADAFIHVLEEKGLEWKKEWHGPGIRMPINAVTESRYNGINRLWLGICAMKNGYEDPRWATFNQIADMDGKYHPGQKWHLKAGSKGTYVEYWFPFDKKEKKSMRWDEFQKLKEQDDFDESRYTLRSRYTPVFNASNIEGMPDLDFPKNPDVKPDKLVAMISGGMSVPVLNDGGDRAYYSQREDAVHLPKPEYFESDYAYNSTALHELSHATGHPSRLNRDQSGSFGSSTYAYEELVAEMSSCFMGANLEDHGASQSELHLRNHQAYVQSWIKAIKEKPETLANAVKDAQNAADYLEWKGGLITEQEYTAAKGRAITVPVSAVDDAQKENTQNRENNKPMPESAKGILPPAAVPQDTKNLPTLLSQHPSLDSLPPAPYRMRREWIEAEI